ncbi:MAG: multiple sugar transport system substrate-binding protein [Gaiellaceae bacterium]|jgi:multiple sugar transport system substrate-binding protein|nr:multiple sugar transport system substrate-binding protein [Gaiellaceae bacterium]
MLVRWKRLLVVAGGVALCIVVAATLANGAPGAAQATLKVYGFGPGDEIANTRADLATRAAGGSVDNPRGGFNDQQFLASVASGDVPDVIYLDRAKVAQYAAKGALQPLTSCIKNQKINLKLYRKATVQEDTYKGRVYGIPEFTNPRTVIVDNRTLQDSGVKVADLNTNNWARLAAANKKMLRVSGGKVTRIGFDPKLPEFFPLWAKANGAEILSKNGLRANLNSPKAVQALTFAYSLIKAHGGWGPFKSFRDTWDFFGSGNQVAKDQIGAWPMESFYYSTLAQNSPGVSITARPFLNRRGGAITLITGNAWAIPKGAKNAGLACTWMKTITATSSWVAAAKKRFDAQKARNRPFTGVYTANAAADVKIYQDIYQKMGNPQFDNAVSLLVAIGKHGFTIPASPAGAEFQTAWMSAVQRVLDGSQSPKKALDQAQKEAQSAINKAQK